MSGAPAAQVSVTGRTTTVVPEGRAGLAYSAVRGSALFNGASWVCGLRGNASDRSNLAVVNAGSTAEGNVRLRITVRLGPSARDRFRRGWETRLSNHRSGRLSEERFLASAASATGHVIHASTFRLRTQVLEAVSSVG